MKALANKKKTAGHDTEETEEDTEETDQETDEEDKANNDLSINRRNSKVKRKRKKRDFQARPGKVRGNGEIIEDISDQESGKSRHLSVATR